MVNMSKSVVKVDGYQLLVIGEDGILGGVEVAQIDKIKSRTYLTNRANPTNRTGRKTGSPPCGRKAGRLVGESFQLGEHGMPVFPRKENFAGGFDAINPAAPGGSMHG